MNIKDIDPKYLNAIMDSIKTELSLSEIAQKYDIKDTSYITTYRKRYLPAILSDYEKQIEDYKLEKENIRKLNTEKDAQIESLMRENAFLQAEIDSHDLSKSNWTSLMPIAILILTTASVLSVGNVLAALFHNLWIGYSVSFVFCNAPLILIMLKKVNLNWGKIAILITLSIEIVCNHANVMLHMENIVHSNIIGKLGFNPYYFSMFIASGLASFACLLEFLWLKESK